MNLTRRTMLGSMAVAALPLASSASPGAPVVDMNHFLANASPDDLTRYHMRALADAMGETDNTRMYMSKLDHRHGFCLVWGVPISEKHRPTAKVFLDDDQPLLADDRMQHTIRARKGGAA